VLDGATELVGSTGKAFELVKEVAVLVGDGIAEHEEPEPLHEAEIEP
jgi:hypothetical protein